MHKKDYTIWQKLKTFLHNEKPRVYFHEREIWWCSLGANIGFEQDGKGLDFARPVLIIRVFSKEVFIGVPLTTKLKDGKYYYPISTGDGFERRVILSQIRLLDSKRLQEKM